MSRCCVVNCTDPTGHGYLLLTRGAPFTLEQSALMMMQGTAWPKEVLPGSVSLTRSCEAAGWLARHITQRTIMVQMLVPRL